MYNNCFLAILAGHSVATIHSVDVDTGINGKFDFKIVSVTPTHADVEFYLTKLNISNTGTIYFKGCLDHRVRETTSNQLILGLPGV